MPGKEFVLDGDLAVTIYKRKTSRNLRLSISPTGQVRVSMPTWAPYRMGVEFVKSRRDWIRAQPLGRQLLKNGQAIGKAHHLEFTSRLGDAKPAGRVRGSIIAVSYPSVLSISDSAVQKAAEKACVRALRAQAEQLLPQRLALLASKHGYEYGQVSVKHLKSRWGSCDQAGNIVLNLFLMQLSWELIDYVLLHELTHTEILRHGPPFWRAMSAKLPNVAEHRKAIRRHQPILTSA